MEGKDDVDAVNGWIIDDDVVVNEKLAVSGFGRSGCGGAERTSNNQLCPKYYTIKLVGGYAHLHTAGIR